MIQSTNKITCKVYKIDEGEIFSTQIFRPLGSQSSVQRVLARLVREVVIARLTQGYYVKPKKSRFGEIFPSPESIARVWATENGYKLVDQAGTEVNRLGLSAQVTMMVVLWGNGPSKQLTIGKSVVEIRHVSDRSLRKLPHNANSSKLEFSGKLSPGGSYEKVKAHRITDCGDSQRGGYRYEGLGVVL